MKTILVIIFLGVILNSTAQSPEVITQEKNLGVINKIVFSNNGRFVASSNEKDFKVKIWDVTSSKLIGTLNGHGSSINNLIFAPDDQTLVSTDIKNQLYFWDLKNWKLKDSLLLDSEISHLNYLTSESLVGATDNNELVLIAKSKSSQIEKFKDKIGDISSNLHLTFIAVGSDLYTLSSVASAPTKIATPNKKSEIDFIKAGDQRCLVHLKNGDILNINIKGEVINQFSSLTNSSSISANYNSNLVAVANNSGEVLLYQLNSGELLGTLRDENSKENIQNISFNTSGKILATSGFKKLLLNKVYSHNNVIQIWDTERLNLQKTLKGDVNPVESFAFNPVENFLYSLRGQQVDVWSLNSGERIGSTTLHERKLEMKDRFKDNVDIKKDETKSDANDKVDDIKNTKVSLNKISSIGKKLGSIQDQAKDMVVEKATETKTSIKEESKLSGKAAFARFGFQEDKIIISPKGSFMLTAFKNDEIRLYSLANGLPEYIDYVKTGQKEFYDIIFDKNEEYLIVGGTGKSPVSIVPIKEIQNPESATLEVAEEEDLKMNGMFQSANALAVSNDGLHLVALFNTGRIVAWQTGSWRKVIDFNPKATLTRFPFIGFSKDGTKLFVNTGLGVYTYDFSVFNRTNTTEETLLGDVLSLKKAKVNGFPVMTHTELDYLISIDDNNVEFLDIVNDKRVITHEIPCKLITDIQVNKFGFAGISLKNGELKIFDPKTGKERFLMVGQDDNAIFKTPENYYKITKEGNELVTFRVGNQSYPFEQFDATNNRPDLVLKAMNSEDENLITLYQKAYEKRISKLGLSNVSDVNITELPKGKIENFNKIPLTTNDTKLKINFSASSSSASLTKLLIWINDVPVAGKNGKTISGKVFKEELEINLASGKNKIQFSVQDQYGRESLKETVEIVCLKETKPNLYILSIGTSIYKDKRYNLDYAAKDATDIVKLFEGKSDLYTSVKTKTITNEQATKLNIEQLKAFLKDAKIDDVVLVFVAGHGLLDANYDYYYGTYDVDFNSPSKKGLAYEVLESILDGIFPLKKILIMDTCHSGEIEEEELMVSAENIESDEDVMFRAVGPALTTIEASPSKMMKELFTDLRRGTGTTVLSSAGGAEFAMESKDWKNGLFTYSLLFGLRNNSADLNEDGVIMLSELQLYVTDRVTKLSHGKQTPNTRIQNITLDYRIW